jgi:hypothetical protein
MQGVMAGMHLLVTAPKRHLCTYNFPIDGAGVGVGETVGQAWAVVEASPPWQCDDLLQRDSEFGPVRPWLAGETLEENLIVEQDSELSLFLSNQFR